ncbi:patatin-like phospholipase family protein [Bradyrhizobium sp. Arg237L]|uniref:patatin-like phospholipase family protein n=1 Tax=Bradyrhizobium sp. Arg237L TaxID=3003352 RepID=UPI00249DB34E|nr:patatin-like phospholipase family protein [Bradyrhizobium sp. Arg237L]MDI4238292.1 patatin-like phospholipase family protein [Bradyrhizobium sp. Arg237L]
MPEAAADQIELNGFNGIRFWGDASPRTILPIVRVSARKAGFGLMPPAVSSRASFNFLAISGGSEDGAFGAGLLTGWSAAGTRPSFDVVTGVSSGALMAPFAFLGAGYDRQLREIFTRYGRKDIFNYNVRGALGGYALADNRPLESLIASYVDDAFLEEIARERLKGRVLLIGTTNLDAQRPVMWDMGKIAATGGAEAKLLFRKILLASATLPGVFPPVRIQVRVSGKDFDELHVDGGVTRQVFVAPAIMSSFQADQMHGAAVQRRLYVIRNGKIDPEWQSVDEEILSVTVRSVSTLIKNQGIGDLYRIHAIARHEGIDFNLAGIPADFRYKADGPFDRSYMIALFDYGYSLAARGYSWIKAPPGLELRPKL